MMKRQGLPKVNDRSKGKGCLVLTGSETQDVDACCAGRGPSGSGDSNVSATRLFLGSWGTKRITSRAPVCENTCISSTDNHLRQGRPRLTAKMLFFYSIVQPRRIALLSTIEFTGSPL